VSPGATSTVLDAVTALFVPGDRPDRFAKAAASGADLVIIDLEDAVSPDRRSYALEQASAALSGADPAHPTLRALVRVTDASSSTHREEVDRLVDLARHPGHGLIGVVVPKAAVPDSLALVVTAFETGTEPIPVVALVESAAGVLAAPALARAPGVARLAFGALDFSLDVGADPDSDTTRSARTQLVLASRAAGLPGPFASPSVEIADLTAVETAARSARADGFGGHLCIHPSQVEVVRRAFLPTEQEARWAEGVLTATDGGASRLEGQMIDRPVLARARRIRRQLDGRS